MAINTALAGKTYPTATYEVTADAIRSYAAATNDDNPAFTGSDPVGPPAFPVVPAQAVLAGALFDSELEVNLMRLVHGEEDHLLLAPIRPGDTLTVEGCLESIEVKESGETFTVFTRLTNQDGVTAAELRSLLFVRGSGARTKAAAEAPPEPEYVFTTSQTVDENQTYRYAEASGDHNPIHVDEEFARTTMFGGTIAHGMLVLALIGEMMFAAHGEGWTSRGKLKVRFKVPARPGDTITASAQLSREDVGSGNVEYAVQCANAAGETVIEGRASIGSAS